MPPLAEDRAPRPPFLRRLLRAVAARSDLTIVVLILAAVFVSVFWLHLIPLPGVTAIRQEGCPTGAHATHQAAPGCTQLHGMP